MKEENNLEKEWSEEDEKAYFRSLRDQALKQFKEKYPNGVKMLTERAQFLE